MSHGDTIMNLPQGFEIIASTRDVKVAGYHVPDKQAYGIQFHPEVYHSIQGLQILRNLFGTLSSGILRSPYNIPRSL